MRYPLPIKWILMSLALASCGYYFKRNKELVPVENSVNILRIEIQNLNLNTEYLEIGLFKIKLSAKLDSSIRKFKILELAFKEVDDSYERKMNQIDGIFRNGEWNLILNDISLPFSKMDMKFKYEICSNNECKQKDGKIRINNNEKLELENRILNALLSV